MQSTPLHSLSRLVNNTFLKKGDNFIAKNLHITKKNTNFALAIRGFLPTHIALGV